MNACFLEEGRDKSIYTEPVSDLTTWAEFRNGRLRHGFTARRADFK